MGHPIAAFFSGMILMNAMPHLVHGISGDGFPTPFAKPPGKGLSPPLLNVAWAVFNILVGLYLWHVSQPLLMRSTKLAFALGSLVMSLALAAIFKNRVRQQCALPVYEQ